MTEKSENTSALPAELPVQQNSPEINSTNKSAIKSTGRTGWDIISLYLEHRAPRYDTNWYQVAFWILLFIVLAVLYIEAKSVFTVFGERVGRIEAAAEASSKSAAVASDTAARIEKSFERTPVVAAQWFKMDIDQAACGGKAIEALKRVGGFDIRTQDSNWYSGSIKNSSGTPSIVLIGCTPNNVALLAVSDWDNSMAFQNRDRLVSAFAERAK